MLDPEAGFEKVGKWAVTDVVQKRRRQECLSS
jgi:hypothetical protein